MKRLSAGILPYRIRKGVPELYLIHMGGPYWKKKERSWSIVKGEAEQEEKAFEAALREFEEETGQRIEGDFLDLGTLESSAKVLHIWAVEAEPSTRIRSNTFRIEWPPHTGRKEEFPEADRAQWFSLEEAREVLVRSQLPYLDRLEEKLSPSR